MNQPDASTSQRPTVSLRVTAGARAGLVLEVPLTGIVLGRQSGGRGNLGPDITMSRSHARIGFATDGRLIIEDLGSGNGTWVNGSRIGAAHQLNIGDTVELGQTRLEVFEPSPSDSTSTWSRTSNASEGVEPSPAPSDPKELLELAEQLLAQKRLSESVAAFEQVVAHAGYESRGYFGAGYVRRQMGDLHGAIRDLEKALEKDPRHVNALYQLGFIAELQKASDRAENYYERALAIDPSNKAISERLQALRRSQAEPKQTRGREHFQSKRPAHPKDSSGAPQEASSSEQDPDQLYKQAERLLQEGKLQESELAFKRLSSRAGYDGKALYGIGYIRRRLGDLGAAIGYLTQALQSEPNNTSALYQLGRIAEQRHAWQEARNYYKRILSVDPYNQAAANSLRGVIDRLDSAPNSSSSLAGHGGARSRGGTSYHHGVYEYLQVDPSPIAQDAVALMDASVITGKRPSMISYVGRYLGRIKYILLYLLLTMMSSGILGILLPIIGLVRVTPIRYNLAKGRLQIRRGVFTKHVTNVDLWRVLGIELEQTFINRWTGDGTLVFFLAPHSQSYDSSRSRRRRRRRFGEQVVEVTGLARGSELEDLYQNLLNLTYMLRGHPVVKGIIQ